jgi:hypothetical protein
MLVGPFGPGRMACTYTRQHTQNKRRQHIRVPTGIGNLDVGVRTAGGWRRLRPRVTVVGPYDAFTWSRKAPINFMSVCPRV